MMDIVYSFIIPPLMVIQILIANYMFALTFQRRKYFWLRYIGFGFVAITVTLWVELIYMLVTDQVYEYGAGVSDLAQSAFNFTFYLAIFVMTIVTTLLSYKESFSRILLCCSGAYATQHIAYNLSVLLQLLPVPNDTGWYRLVTVLVSYVAIYTLTYFLFARALKAYGTYEGNNMRKLMLSLTVILVCIVMSRLTSDNPDRSLLSVIAESVYAIVSCAILLISQFGVVENDSMHHEVDSITELLIAERRQYELSRENIKLINEKCHDLKHQISALRENASEESIAEIEHAVMIYDSMVKTGHDVLDVILTEKKLQCESRQIQMTCMIKGELISFIENMDVYSLFGNALSNAIESVSGVEEQNRCVGITVKNKGNMVSIHIENYYKGDIVFKDGLPVTTKSDKDYHGFGMASMRRVVRKYGGEMYVSANDGKFVLDFMIPSP